MRKNMVTHESNGYKIMVVFLKRSGYDFTGLTNPLEAIETIKAEHFDMLILDFMMDPIHGDEVVEEIRKFNKELYILLLTGHKDLAPPLETIKRLDIQGYCEKSDKFDQLLLLIESGIKSIEQMKTIQKINEQLQNKNDELENAYLDTIGILRQTVEARDPYTRGHSDRVSEFAVLIGTKMGLDEQTLHTLKIGGLFHDIGKIGIPDSILLKESKLSDDEYSQIKNHPTIGAHILGNATVFQDIIPIVKYHHERYDGRGYPSQLAGTKIPLVSRITAIADAFDAMTSKRTYRDAVPIEKVKEEIERCSGTQFDPEIATLFLDILNNEYNSILKIQEQFKS